MGGNVFQGTSSIDLSEINVIQKKLRSILPGNMYIVGSAWSKSRQSLGDFDVVAEVPADITDPAAYRVQLAANLVTATGYEVTRNGQMIHIKLPINDKFVQVDIVVTPGAQNVIWAHRHVIPENSIYRASHKHILMSKLAKSRGWTWSPWKGFVRGTEVVTDPAVICKTILPDAVKFDSVETILAGLSYEERTSVLAELADDPKWVS